MTSQICSMAYFEGQVSLAPLLSGAGVKFIYSEKATKFCEIFTLLLTGTTYDKSKVKISQNFVAFSEYMNFKKHLIWPHLTNKWNI